MEEKDLLIKKQSEIIDQQSEVIKKQLKINEEFSKITSEFPKINKINIQESQKSIRCIIFGAFLVIAIIAVSAMIIVANHVDNRYTRDNINSNINVVGGGNDG